MRVISNVKQYGRELLYIVIGSIIYALSVVLFIDPAKIIPGSVTGIAVIAKALFGIPIGLLSVIINVPLILIAVFYLGRKMLVYTILTVLLTSALIDWWAFLPPFTDNMLLAAIFGGIMMGVGMGMMLPTGATTGGTTVVGRLVLLKYPNIPIGYILLIVDFIIIVVGSMLLKDWDLMLYSILNLYVCVVVINKVMYGMKIDAMSVVFTEHSKEILQKIQATFPCKVSALSDIPGLLCICRKSDVNKLQRIVERTDPSAFCASLDLDYSFGKNSAKQLPNQCKVSE
ncbi:YitT family protein [Sporomusa sphaeroides]|uniref:DUF2179 domain-containing protein n=1 Tax=Sporomusa sphaeroides DSM 2875 TaxID=1337886 RepID=A0ABM9W6P3_9FIRM|nr:YitT family protein [Sporomusa sphaeroides]OLS54635.1 hypothetical protein SPSPH_44270 [Sporomusa sphaeroides DSM 2875]CVK20834.1 hypothetical protein SSPH_03502 [Sporomusa sphaeroides DSM 2875]